MTIDPEIDLPDDADPTDVLSLNSVAGKDSVSVNGVAGLLQLLIDGTPAA